MSLLYFLPELLTRLAAMTAFTIVVGMTGFIFIISIFDSNRLPKSYGSFGMAISAGLILIILPVIGIGALGIPITKTSLSMAFISIYAAAFFRLLGKISDVRKYLLILVQRKSSEYLLPVLLFIISLILRAIQIRGVLVPNGFDGLSHAYLLQRFVTTAEIPLDNIYHIGFHTIALAAYYFGGFSIPETILILGQWLSAASGLTFYYLTLRYTRSTYTAGISYIVYSFFLMLPSYLTFWGRYPFLLGLTLLPFTILTSLNWITNHKSNYSVAAMFVIALGLTHYGSLLIWFSSIITHLIGRLVFERKDHPGIFEQTGEVFTRSALLFLPLAIVILPKTINLINHPVILDNLMSRVKDVDFGFDAQYLLELLYPHDFVFFFIWLACLPWLFFRKRKLLLMTLLWPLATWSLIWAQYKLMGFSISSYVNLIVFFSIPLALAFGFFVQGLLLYLKHINPLNSIHNIKYLQKGFFSILLIIGLLSGPHSIDREKSLFANEDALAMNWIGKNTQKNSGFLIRTIIWSNKTVIPSDGGGWINLLTGRRIIIPNIGELYDVCDFSKRNGVNYIYFGKKQQNETFDLRLDELARGNYTIVYKNQSVIIISLTCP
jgi:hypothetical protein